MSGSKDADTYVFTSESVTEGHPDKVCDQISDAILDEILIREIELADAGYLSPAGERADVRQIRVACETLVTKGLVVLAGEIRTQAYVDIERVVRDVIEDIGYSDPDSGFHCNSVGIINAIHEQSSDIAQGVDKSFEVQHDIDASDPYELTGAGDQGMMFGYACDETPVLMPMPVFLAHRLAERLTAVRKEGILDYLRPDGKTQVSVRYEGGQPVAVEKVLISTQHAADVDVEGTLKDDLIKQVITPVFERWNISWNPDEVDVNPTGRFVIGGPTGDTGVTGRKIIVDTYGGKGRHGGGCFSGKDATKVDRSAAYAARWVAKNIVAAGLARRCEVQIAYGIGMAEPLSLMVDTFGTATADEGRIARAVQEVFDLRPGAIIDALELRRPIFRLTTNYGHFGRELAEFTWEKTNRAEELKQAITRLS
ncbi:MAG: methionine adenosyltransferase [Coriobacteriales bacterium]|jgi:S-adenosylmethionine synthetase|nr:methionine adenosyltransferase [Coriobacteriales bacterium]